MNSQLSLNGQENIDKLSMSTEKLLENKSFFKRYRPFFSLRLWYRKKFNTIKEPSCYSDLNRTECQRPEV